ncbi:acyltransferase family protein [Vagococcus fluvialis]|uniref:acyltransferase family protein n=2 Tax=Vagococcus fluvialis TaxID=2738 RepID=UPI003B21F58B
MVLIKSMNYSGLCILVENKNGILYKIISDLFIMSFGYAIITLLGLWVYKQNTKDNLIFTSYFLIIFILLLIKYNFYTMISYKYPPYPFYLSYGFLVSIVLWQLLSFDKIKEKTSNIKCVKWFSTNSMTVYYWHIIPVFYLENYIKDSYLANTWWLAYAAVLGFSILGTILQNNIKIIYKKRIY